MRKIMHALFVALLHVIVLITAHGVAVEISGLVRDEIIVNTVERAIRIAWEP